MVKEKFKKFLKNTGLTKSLREGILPLYMAGVSTRLACSAISVTYAAARNDCDYLSKMGPVKKDAPGFPSGHMTTTAFFALYKAMENKNNAPLLTLLTAIVIAMSWSRHFKKCHNVVQIIGGILLGGGSAFLVKRFV